MQIVDIHQYPKAMPTRYGKIRLHIWPQNESILQNLVNRTSRPHKLYREILPEIFKKAGLPASTRASWSQKAGCRCGCSPGFVLDSYGFCDISVTVSDSVWAEGNEEERTYRAGVAAELAAGTR